MGLYIKLDDHFSLNVYKIVETWFGDPDFHRLYIKTINGYIWSTTDQERIEEFMEALK